MTNDYSTGGYIDAWCTKCKLELGHTIIAMVHGVPKRVECNTCKGKHNYRTAPSVIRQARPKTTVRKRRTPEDNYNEHITRVTGGDLSQARKYLISGNYSKDDVIDHPKFGVGIVLTVIQSNKMEALFKDGSKLLVQNQQ